MSALDRLTLSLNAIALALLMVAFVTRGDNAFILFSVAAVAAFVASSAAILHRSSPTERRPVPLAPEAIHEMDPAKVLDLDGRLEALERRERELDEAGRIQQLVARGQQHAPMSSLTESVPPGTVGFRSLNDERAL